jgi:hypothetical protein
MKRLILLLLFITALPAGISASQYARFTVLQWNIWQEGTIVPGGYQAIVDGIARLKPDFVTLSEVRNYHGQNFTARLIRDLRQRGLHYYSFRSDDSGVLSRYPLTDSVVIYPWRGDHGSMYKLTTRLGHRKLCIYTCHLDYQNDAYYEVRGFNGNTYRPMTPLTDPKEILSRNALSKREETIRLFIKDALKEVDNGAMVVLGGDFNEPSHLDWTMRASQLFDRHGVAVDWPCTKMLETSGFRDAWRVCYPNEIKHPGFTYPSHNNAVPIEHLGCTPQSDERERIDYLFYQGLDMNVRNIRIFGPASCIRRGQREPSRSRDRFIRPEGVWPSDHKALFATFRYEK